MSFGRRIELLKAVREVAGRLEFLKAGGGDSEGCEALLLEREVERIYLDWGLVSVEGLMIDGRPATKQSVIEAGPEPLVKEIIGAIERQIVLSEDERKN
jgi:hypothetical protein